MLRFTSSPFASATAEWLVKGHDPPFGWSRGMTRRSAVEKPSNSEAGQSIRGGFAVAL
jgi:hypothetical protein